MANGYSLFCTALESITKEEEDWIRKDLKEPLLPDANDDPEIYAIQVEEWANEKELKLDDDEPENWPQFSWSWEKSGEETVLCLFSEENFTSSHLISFIQRFIRRFRPDFTFCVEGAFTCSKHLPGEFGGWWLVVTANEVRGGGTSNAMREAAADMENKVPLNRVVDHLDHVDQLEIAVYRTLLDPNEPISTITAECTRCRCVVHELYNADIHGDIKEDTVISLTEKGMRATDPAQEVK
jgi:hypothetical protein